MTTTQSPTRSEIRIALGLTATLLFCVVLLSAVLNDQRGLDFTNFYAAGLIISKGSAGQLYDLEEQARIERQIMNRGNPLIYLHPPFEA